MILSRSSIKFVRRLLDLEVTEIADGTVTVEGMAREPGYRTKIAVNSNDPKVDPVGACVGSRGARVKSVVRELGGEKIDIIRYYEDPHKMLEEALRPAVPRNIEVNADKRRIFFRVSEGDIRVTLGKGGINAKLTSKLMGWKLDIEKLDVSGPRDFKDQVSSAASEISSRLGIEMDLARRLVERGFNSLSIFEGVSSEDLVDAEFSQTDADLIIQKLSALDSRAQ